MSVQVIEKDGKPEWAALPGWIVLQGRDCWQGYRRQTQGIQAGSPRRASEPA